MLPPSRRCRAAFCAALLLAGSAAAETKRVDVPLVIPPAFLQRLLVEQVFSEPDSTARIVALADPCSEIVLSQPALRPRRPHILVGAHGSAQAGVTFFNGCWVPFAWEGEVEAEEEPRLAEGGAPVVEFRVADSRLSDSSQSFGIPLLWDWIKPAVHPRLEVLRVDLGPLLGDLRRALPLFAAKRDEPAARRLGDSLVLASAKVDERGLVLGVRFEVETEPRVASPPQEEAPLTSAELAAFETRLHEWDAFLTFVIKSAGREALDPSLRAALLEVLLEARYEIIAALAEPGRDGPDRVRALFQSSWQRLQPELTPLSGGREGLRYLAFVASGDALAALDQAGPSFGVEISSDGLRHLARTLVPQSREDPLRWSEEVDPALRETFGFDAELPAVPRRDAEAAPGSAPAPASTPSPAPTPLPPLIPVTPPDVEPAPEPGAALRPFSAFALQLADLFWPAASAASDPLAQPGRLPAPGPQSSTLDGFVPRLSELDRYLPEVDSLLRDASASVFASGRLRPDLREPFERLVLATAWQESCWRQYVRSKGKVAPLRSSVGALGLMQVNPRAWRGFYSVDGLAWSIGYNARAGSEVLLHYLRDYALARYEDQVGGPDALARATYSAYNGGPMHLRRYRQPQRWRKALVAVDRSFLAKYRALASGAELPVRECFPG